MPFLPLRLAPLVLAATVALSGTATASVLVTVNKATQRMTVLVDARDPALLAGVDRDEGLCDASRYLQAFSSGGGALLEGVGRRADAALNLFHPSGARDPRQQRDPTSRVTCVARLHPDRTRECRQAICARQRRGTD